LTFKKLLLVLTLAFSFGAGAYVRFHDIDPGVSERTGVDAQKPGVPDADVVRSPDPEEDSLPEKLDIAGRINILLLGEDNVDGVKRSDTVAFIALDIDERNMRVLSLPRDTRVYIPGHGNQKLNHAYAYGKAELLKATVERFLGVTIHYYVKIDYDNFPKLVDIVGGVDLYVGKHMKYTDRRATPPLVIDIPEGKQHMDGETALKYVRFRNDALGDIGRIQRQQQFLKALLNKMYEPENLLRFATLSREITNTLATDLRPSMTLQLCAFVRKLDKEKDRVFFMMLPGTPALIDNLSYWVAEPSAVSQFLSANADDLRNLVKESKASERRAPLNSVTDADDYSPDSPNGLKAELSDQDTTPSPQDVMSIIRSIPEAVAVLNGTGKSGVGQSVASHLQKMGVDVVSVGNAKHFDYRSSNIIYPEGAPESTRQTAQLLSKLCGISGSLTRANKMASYPSLIVGKDYELLLKRLENSYFTMQ
jgi:LCP family protein required for cell wall assembly